MMHQEREAVILIGHGSLRSASGASMIRIAARLRERGVAPVVEAAFLNYSRPTLAETVAKAAAAGATAITVQPYFLIAGVYVQNDLRALVAEVSASFPSIIFRLAPVLGEHPALTGLAQRRAQATLGTIRIRHSERSEESPSASLQESNDDAPVLLLMAHGTPLPAANAPLYTIAETVARNLGLAESSVGYLDCNTPDIPSAIDQLVSSGARHILALPYFLHLGRHVAEDLPRLVTEAQARHLDTTIHLAHHLDYDLALVDAVQGLLPSARPLTLQRGDSHSEDGSHLTALPLL
jgi:sirohydrochlorin cobaltochelatase